MLALSCVPFTYATIIRNLLRRSKTILDVGCGDGSFMTQINSDNKFDVLGIDFFDPYIKKAKVAGVYKNVVKMDIKKMQFNKQMFDSVLASQVVEHFTKKEALKIIRKMEKHALSTIVIGTPNGRFDQDPYDGNKLQKHLSQWTVDEFRKIGYTVYGQGLKIVYGQDGLLETNLGKFKIWQSALILISYFLSPFIYIFPQHATYLIAVKNKTRYEQNVGITLH